MKRATVNMLVCALLVLIGTSGHAVMIIDSGGFESNSAGSLEGQNPVTPGAPTTWQATVGTTSSVVVQSGTALGTNAVGFTRAAGSFDRLGVQVANPVTPSVNIVTASWDMYIPTPSAPLPPHGPVFGFEMVDAGSTGNPLLLGFLGVDQSTGKVCFQDPATGGAFADIADPAGPAGQLLSAPYDTWNSFQIELDYSTSMQRLFFNGAQVMSAEFVDQNNATFNPGNVPLTQFTDASMTALAGAGDAASLNAVGTGFFDNVTVTAVPEPSPVLYLGLVCLALGFKRRFFHSVKPIGMTPVCLLVVVCIASLAMKSEVRADDTEVEITSSQVVRNRRSFDPFAVSRGKSSRRSRRVSQLFRTSFARFLRTRERLIRTNTLASTKTIPSPPPPVNAEAGEAEVVILPTVSVRATGFRPPPRSPFRPPLRGGFRP